MFGFFFAFDTDFPLEKQVVQSSFELLYSVITNINRVKRDKFPEQKLLVGCQIVFALTVHSPHDLNLDQISLILSNALDVESFFNFYLLLVFSKSFRYALLDLHEDCLLLILLLLLLGEQVCQGLLYELSHHFLEVIFQGIVLFQAFLNCLVFVAAQPMLTVRALS